MSSYGSISLTVSERCPVNQFIINRLVRGERVIEEECTKIARRTLQGSSVAVSFLGTIPFIPICYRYAGVNRPNYGTVLAISNSASFTWFTAWAFLKILEEEMGPRSEEEMQLIARSNGSCYFSAVKVGLVFVGVITQIPPSFMAYFYNNNNISYGSFAMVACVIQIYSLLKMASAIRIENSLTSFEEKLHAIKGYLIEHLSKNQELFFSLVKEKSELITQPKEFTEFLGTLFEDETLNLVDKEHQPVSTTTGAVLAGAYLLFIATLGYHAVGLWTDVEGARLLGGFLIAACSGYLTVGGMIGQAQRASSAISNFACGSFTPSISFQEKPYLAGGLWLIGLVLTAFSYAPAEQVCNDYYSGWTKSSMEILVPAGTMLMIANAIGDFVDAIILVQLDCWGTEEQKQLVDFLERLRHFENLLKNCPIPQFAKFLKQFPPRVAEQYLKRVQSKIEDLNRYILALPTS